MCSGPKERSSQWWSKYIDALPYVAWKTSKNTHDLEYTEYVRIRAERYQIEDAAYSLKMRLIGGMLVVLLFALMLSI